jgi:hypothetical protein
VIDELGAVSSSTVPTNSSEALIATIRMRALAAGQASFTSDPAEGSGTDLLLYSRDDAVPEASIGFGSVALTVTAPYTATDDNVTVDEDSTDNVVDALPNDEATAGANTTLSLVSVGTPGHGQALIVNGEMRYTPDPDYFGADSFTYVVEDQNGSAQTATVHVTVTGTNDPPNAVDDSFQVATDSGATQLDLLANDNDAPDSGETLTLTAVGATSNGGSVAIASDGSSVSYTPASGFTGTDSFSYTVSDGTTTSTATVNVSVGQTNAPPTAVNDAFTLAEDSFDAANDPAADAEYDVLANDSPSDSGETISLRSVGSSAHGAAVRLSDDGSKIFYAPAADFFGTDPISYTIVDSAGAEATATVTFTVTAVNDPPPADAISQSVLTGAEAVTVATLDDLGTNVDGEEAVTFTELGTTSAGGTAQIASDGESVVYTPPSDTYTGTDTFAYTVTDASGATSTGEVTLTVREYVPRSFTVSLDRPELGSTVQLGSVSLRGTTDFGETVEQTGHFSATDGTLTFADLAPGEYEIEVPAMPFLAGGANPQIFSIDSNADSGNVDDLVAELGPLLPRYVSIRDYLITTPSQTILAAVQAGQSSVWVAPSNDLGGMSNPRLSLNDNGSAFELEITDANDQTQQATVPVDDAESVDLREELDGVQLVRINVSPDVVTYSPGISSSASASEAEGEAASNGGQAAPLSVPLTGEGESTGSSSTGLGSTGSESDPDLASLAARRTAALDAAYADVAEDANRPTTAETLLEERDPQGVDSQAVDAVVSLFSDRDSS